MNRFKITTAMLGLLTACFAPSMRADDNNKETRMTINGPLQVQDILLAPGQYVFKLTNPDAVHTVVSIFDADGARLEGITMGWSAYRTDAGDKKLFTVSQSQGNQLATLKYWFYSGDNFGLEFAAKTLARETGRVVKYKKGQTTEAADDALSTRY